MARRASAEDALPSFEVSSSDKAFATEFAVPQRITVPSNGQRVTLALGNYTVKTVVTNSGGTTIANALTYGGSYYLQVSNNDPTFAPANIIISISFGFRFYIPLIRRFVIITAPHRIHFINKATQTRIASTILI